MLRWLFAAALAFAALAPAAQTSSLPQRPISVTALAREIALTIARKLPIVRGMTPHGDRLACTLRTLDGCRGTFSVLVGRQPGTVGDVEPITWNQPPRREVLEAVFTLFRDISMTGQFIMLDQHQWRALTLAKLETFLYAAIIWGKDPAKVLEDAEFIARRIKPDRSSTRGLATLAAR